MTFEMRDSWQSYHPDELFAEYADSEIGTKILQTIYQLCKQTADPRRYHVATYNKGRPWNVAAWEDLAQEVCEEQLYGQNSIVWVFESGGANQIGSIEGRIVAVIKRQLAVRRREIDPIETRLKNRCLKHAEEFGFEIRHLGQIAVISKSRNTGDTSPDISDWSPQKIRRVACTPAIASIPKLFTQSEQKQSMGYSLTSLMMVLEIIVGSEIEVSERNLEAVFRELFTFLANHAHVKYEDDYNLSQVSTMDLLNQQTQADLKELTAAISDRQAEGMLYKLHGYSDEEIRATTGVSRPTIQKDRERIVAELQNIAKRNELDEQQGPQLLDEFFSALEDRVAAEPGSLTN